MEGEPNQPHLAGLDRQANRGRRPGGRHGSLSLYRRQSKAYDQMRSRSGRSPPAGPLNGERAVPNPRKDITGQRFGKLVAIAPAWTDGQQQLHWKCRCDCGAISYPLGYSLRTGHTTSCGCKAEMKDIAGQRFGKLVAIAPVRVNGRSHWQCTCDCGATSFPTGWNLRRGRTKSCGCVQAERNLQKRPPLSRLL